MNFAEHFDMILNKVKDGDYFSFSKYADGEYKILRNEKITNCDNWTFDPDKHRDEQKMLLDSFMYDHPDYFVGVSCPCCQPMPHCQWMRDTVQTKNITWANLFVNSNYPRFKSEMFTAFNQWKGKVTLVANEAGEGKPLPFKVDNYVPCNGEAFLFPSVAEHIVQLQKAALEEDNQLFLFSAGPLGNILAHRLHLANQNNTYIDIGSTINPWLVGLNRGYLKNPQNLKTCIWT